MSTPFDEPSLEILKKVDVDLIKVASFDLGNLPFLNRIKELKASSHEYRWGKINQIRESVKILNSKIKDLAILWRFLNILVNTIDLALETLKIY